MPDENKTEQPTPRRRQKAREQGQIARSRELPSALALIAITGLLVWQAPAWAGQWRALFRRLLDTAASGDMSGNTAALQWSWWTTVNWAAPALLIAWCIAVISSLAPGGLVFAPSALTRGSQRLSPASNLQQLLSSAALSRTLKSLVPVSAIVYLSVAMVVREWGTFVHASYMGSGTFTSWLFNRAFELSWKGALVLLVWVAADYYLQWRNLEGQLRMSRAEVREETKETEGHPTIKGRIRRLQRQLRRRRMLHDVARASVVVTNPTHFAVALAYDFDNGGAPVVVAKGCNRLAQRIRELARWHGIPLMENPPLAQALYRAVDVGQAIPTKLYVAVAEVLAFVYRAQEKMRAKR